MKNTVCKKVSYPYEFCFLTYNITLILLSKVNWLLEVVVFEKEKPKNLKGQQQLNYFASIFKIVALITSLSSSILL